MDPSALLPKPSNKTASPSPNEPGDGPRCLVGTSGFQFPDWLGTFYPTRTRDREMFSYYVRSFETVEINFTYYRMPTARTFARLKTICPPHFRFWVKANGGTTHERDRTCAPPFLESLAPLRENGSLAGVLLQFPQSFHRTPNNRRYLAAALEDFRQVDTAVEFRHQSWNHPGTLDGLRQRNASLVIPDVPNIPQLFRRQASVTTRTGYLRLHSRDAAKWYAGPVARYDYDYDQAELQGIRDEWRDVATEVDTVYAFFNNCHGGQAAKNAQAFRRLLGQIT